ncbi:MAG: diacylglycerol kinase family protein, partial [Planctomycetota bacterium]
MIALQELGYDPPSTMASPASPRSTAPRSALVITNPIAGAGRGERLARELAAELERAGLRVEMKLTTARGDARKFAAEITADALLCVGGDGTVNEVLHGLANRDVPVGIMPLGTANVLAVDLSLSCDARVAARTVLEGRTAWLDTALVNGELSFLVVGVGFDAAAVREVELRRRGPISKLTYIGAGFRALWNYVEPVLEVEIDGTRAPGTFGWILVSNVIHYAGILRLSADR